ncbi:MAG: hypothetical protein HY811_03760 [Planctomycetes bacterium]|nr:hypothetical protein [Planctomycetota bacterium]
MGESICFIDRRKLIKSFKIFSVNLAILLIVYSLSFADNWSETTFTEGVFTSTMAANDNNNLTLYSSGIRKVNTGRTGDADIMLNSGGTRHLTRDSNNVLHIVWETGGYVYYSSSSNEGTTWAAATTVWNTNTNIICSDIIVDGNNNIHCVFAYNASDDNRMYHRRKTAAGAWDATRTVNAGHASSDEAIYMPQSVVDSANTLYIIYDRAHYRGYGMKSFDGANWSAVTAIYDQGSNDAYYQAAQAIGTNLYHISRMSSDQYYYFIRRTGGAWVTPHVAITNFKALYPSMIVDKDDNIWVFLNDITSSPYPLKARKYTVSTNTWDAAWTTIDSGASSCAYPSATVNSAGDIYVFYNIGANIYYKVRNYSTGVWGARTQLTDSATDGACYFPNVKYQRYNHHLPDKIELTCRQGAGAPYNIYYIAIDNSYVATGTYISSAITAADVSYWGFLNYTIVSPANTALTVDVLNSSDNSLLVASVPSGTNLQEAYPATFNGISGIKLRANLSTSDQECTPTLSDWRIDYYSGTVVTTTNWVDLINGAPIRMGQSVAMVKFDMKTVSGASYWKKIRIDKGLKTYTNIACPDSKIEIQIWCENNGNGFWDIGDMFIAKDSFGSGVAWINTKRWLVTTTSKTYYIVYKLSSDIGGGQRAGVKILDSSYLEFENATCVGVP